MKMIQYQIIFLVLAYFNIALLISDMLREISARFRCSPSWEDFYGVRYSTPFRCLLRQAGDTVDIFYPRFTGETKNLMVY